MGHLDPLVENGGTAKYDVRLEHLEVLLYVLDALKPDEVNHPCPIAEVGYQSALPPLSGMFDAQYLALDLDVRHVGIQVADSVDAAPIDIFIWVIGDQVAQGEDAQLLVERGGSLGAYTTQKLDVTLLQFKHGPVVLRR